MKTLIRVLLFATLSISALIISASDDCSESTDECEFPEYGISAEEIALNPDPNVELVPFNEDLIYDRWYKQVNGTTDVYDVPNGNVIRTIDTGFNFVTALQESDGWTKINPDEWVKTENLTNSGGTVSWFTGVLLPDSELPYTVAWTLVNLYPSKVPGGEPRESNEMHYRYTLVYIYDTVEIDDYRWYQIGEDKWVHQFNVAKIEPVETPTDVDTDRWISIDLYEQTLIAYQGDTPVFATLIATGQDRWPTREGVYNIYYRKTRKHMSGGVVGDDYYFLEEVPWTMFFDEGRALHGAYWHDAFGYRRSHGCVNLSLTDAHWLYQWVAETFDGKLTSADVEEGPAVYVYSSDNY
jgi:hypothetical protein